MLRALSLLGMTFAAVIFAQALPDPVSPDPNGVRPIEAADLRLLPFHLPNEIRPVGQIERDITQRLVHGQ